MSLPRAKPKVINRLRNRYVIGIDPSTVKIAATVTRGDTDLKMHRVLIPKNDITESIVFTQDWVQAIVEEYVALGPTYVWVESPVGGFGKALNIQVLIKLSMFHGAMVSGAVKAGATVSRVAPSEWKKEVIGNGRADKPTIASWLHQYWEQASSLANKDQDLKDSACINRYGAIVLKRMDIRERA